MHLCKKQKTLQYLNIYVQEPIELRICKTFYWEVSDIYVKIVAVCETECMTKTNFEHAHGDLVIHTLHIWGLFEPPLMKQSNDKAK